MRTRWIRNAAYSVGLVIVIVSFSASPRAAGPTNAPEIDGSGVSAGLGLLAAGALIVRSRMKSK